MRDARIDNAQGQAALAREHIDGRAAAQEVGHHLRRDFLRIGRDARARRAMVARKHGDAWAREHRHGTALQQADLQREGFEPAEAATRLGAAVEPGLQTRGQRRIVKARHGGVEAGRMPGGKTHAGSIDLSGVAKPATTRLTRSQTSPRR